jgi:hypothetical protein
MGVILDVGSVRHPCGGSSDHLHASSEEPMKTRLLWSGLVASAVVLATGTAFSGGAGTSDNLLVDFNQATGELLGYPNGGGLTTYLHTPQTHHVIADLSHFAPPDPCRELAHTWNKVVRWDERKNVTSTFVFEVLLTLMSDYQCHATVTSIDGTPQPIVYIAPSAK